MTEKEILQNNKLIAEFMGLDVLYTDMVHHKSTSRNMVTKMKYDSSWDWLMPVINKIGMLNFGEVEGLEEEIDYFFGCDINQLFFPIDRVYFNVVQFIKWYNESK